MFTTIRYRMPGPYTITRITLLRQAILNRYKLPLAGWFAKKCIVESRKQEAVEMTLRRGCLVCDLVSNQQVIAE